MRRRCPDRRQLPANRATPSRSEHESGCPAFFAGASVAVWRIFIRRTAGVSTPIRTLTSVESSASVAVHFYLRLWQHAPAAA